MKIPHRIIRSLMWWGMVLMGILWVYGCGPAGKIVKETSGGKIMCSHQKHYFATKDGRYGGFVGRCDCKQEGAK